jgi:hypothetical protein
MADGLFLAFTHPRAAQTEEQMNTWYSRFHLPEILRVPGVETASRYRSLDPDPEFAYLAAYNLRGDNLRDIVARIFADGPNRTPTEATRQEPPTSFALYEFIESQQRR